MTKKAIANNGDYPMKTSRYYYIGTSIRCLKKLDYAHGLKNTVLEMQIKLLKM